MARMLLGGSGGAGVFNGRCGRSPCVRSELSFLTQGTMNLGRRSFAPPMLAEYQSVSSFTTDREQNRFAPAQEHRRG